MAKALMLLLLGPYLTGFLLVFAGSWFLHTSMDSREAKPSVWFLWAALWPVHALKAVREFLKGRRSR